MNIKVIANQRWDVFLRHGLGVQYDADMWIVVDGDADNTAG